MGAVNESGFSLIQIVDSWEDTAALLHGVECIKQAKVRVINPTFDYVCINWRLQDTLQGRLQYLQVFGNICIHVKVVPVVSVYRQDNSGRFVFTWFLVRFGFPPTNWLASGFCSQVVSARCAGACSVVTGVSRKGLGGRERILSFCICLTMSIMQIHNVSTFCLYEKVLQR